ncbi:MAG: hypothetical protein JXB38_04520 [Anaerolineales bacterium]|nr:hypothetical protein [Anaerolineales bacterium]
MYTKRIFQILVLGLLIVSSVDLSTTAYAQTGEPDYFPETGHTLTGEYFTFYYSIPNPKEVYGFPITEPFYQESFGLQVQFFEKARFEYHPEKPEGERIVLTNLGEFTHDEGAPINLTTYAGGCKILSDEVDHRYPVCYSFLTFYEANGGAEQFGLPISEMEMQSGYIMQYFERARLEWHPALPDGKKVVIGNLGEVYFNLLHLSPPLLYPVPDPDENNLPVQKIPLVMVPRAFVRSAVVGNGEVQTVYVTVEDQNNVPVEDAKITGSVLLPNSLVVPLNLAPTDEDGVSKAAFTVQAGDQTGMATVVIEVQKDGEKETFRTSFRIWY